jgi:hypothetical protein
MFPKDKSMQPDSIGTRDMMAVVVSKQPLDWYKLNLEISKNPNQDYGQRLNAALSGSLVRNVRFQSSSKGTMEFSVAGNENQVVASIIEINKQ